MKALRTIAGLLTITFPLCLAGCFGGGSIGSLNFNSLVYATVTVSPRPVSMAAGTTQTFTATTTNSGGERRRPGPSVAPSMHVGRSRRQSFRHFGDTVTYTAPSTPPIYTGTPSAETQGNVLLIASVQPTNGNVLGSSPLQIIITAPTVSVGLAPATTRGSVALGATQQFYGYEIGSATQGLTWQVNGVTGGSASYGTITQSAIFPFGGLYTAPAIMPMTGATVPITMISQADPTKTQTAVITLH